MPARTSCNGVLWCAWRASHRTAYPRAPHAASKGEGHCSKLSPRFRLYPGHPDLHHARAAEEQRPCDAGHDHDGRLSCDGACQDLCLMDISP